MERDFELMQWLDAHNYAEAWIGEHHSGGYEIYGQPELFIATAAERTRYIRLGTGVISLPYHHPLMVADRIVQLGKEPRLLKSEILKLKEIFDPMRLRRLDVDRGHDQLVIDQLRSGAGSQQTPRWRKMDSNFQYAGAVSLGCRPFSRARLRGRAGAVGAGYRGSACLSGELPKRSTVIPNQEWIAWPNSCARRGRARAAAGSASLRTRSKHWRRRWPSGRRSG